LQENFLISAEKREKYENTYIPRSLPTSGARILNQPYSIIKTNETNRLGGDVPCRGVIVAYFFRNFT
jgi:hypothetical protein